MGNYKALNNQSFTFSEFSIVPIRYQDRFNIMHWRNEQLYHLRQKQPLTKADQDNYFSTIIADLFEKKTPDQLLFSYLRGDKCIGYGGLVHINWIDRNAEISFIMDTELEEHYFEHHWTIFIKLLEKVAFQETNLHKISTYAFDLRPRLYPIFEKLGFTREAVLREHCFFEGKYIDVIIHSKTESDGY